MRTLSRPPLLASLLAAGLCGCLPGGSSTQTAGSAGLSAPEPARFGARQEPQPSPAAAALMSSARELAAIAPASGSGAEADLRAVQEGRVRFDGAGRTSSAPEPVFSGKPMVVRAGMAIDTDGAYSGSDPRITRDPYRQRETSLRYRDGSSLNPAEIPYVVVPSSHKRFLGDFVQVEYRGRRVLAVVGDVGPRFGEGSVALAERLGIPASGVSGGVSGGVTYSFHPGSGRRFSGPADLQTALAEPQDRMRLASL